MSYTPLHGIQSTVNTSTTPLSGGATFTGTAELDYSPDVMCSCYADVAGTLYFDFSVDGTNWRTFPSTGFTVSAGVHEFHIARKGPRYFRARYINGGSAQAAFQLYTYFGWFGQGISPIGFTIADDADAIVTKSVISGVGDTTATVTDHKSLQVTPPREGKSAFGSALVESQSPVIQLKFPYDFLDSKLVDTRANQSGTVTAANSMAVCSTGAAANSSGELLSSDIVTYRPGQGIVAKFTALFTTGVANSTQLCGIGNGTEGFYFGYNGTSFGVMRRSGGVHEVRTLTVTTKSTTAENITITLDGDADATVAVTDATAGDTTTTANDIAAHDYSDVGRGWTAKAVGSTVVFRSWDVGTQSGTYSLSGASTAVGTFAQTLAGASPTDTWTAQASWNGSDIFDGNGLTGVTLDPTKGNVYQIKFQYLGFGAIEFYVEDPDDGELHLIHTIAYANANTTPSLDNPSLPMYMGAINTSNTSSLSVKSASLSAFIEGEVEEIGPRRGTDVTATIASANETPFITIRVNEVFKSKANRTKIKLLRLNVSVEHTKPLIFRVYKNMTLTGASFSSIHTDSVVQQSTSETAATGGTFLFSLPLSKSGQRDVQFPERLDGVVSPGDSITLTADAFSGTGAEVTASLYWVELV